MMIRKAFSQGASLAVCIPAKYRRALGLKTGDHVFVELLPDNTLLIRRLYNATPLKKRSTLRGANQATDVITSLRLPKA